METKQIVSYLEDAFQSSPHLYRSVAQMMGVNNPPWVDLTKKQSYHFKRKFKRQVYPVDLADDGEIWARDQVLNPLDIAAVRGFHIGVLGYTHILMVFESKTGELHIGQVVRV